MKKIAKCILALTLIGISANLAAQQVYYDRVYYAGYKTNSIDWNPREKEGKRFNIAIHPFYVLYDGLRLDYEYELKEPGQWINFQLMVNYASMYSDSSSIYEGWSNLASGLDEYQKLRGFGAGIAYKVFTDSRGWYVSPGVSLNYYNVFYNDDVYVSYTEEGNTYYENRVELVEKDFVKVSFDVNVGRHFNLGKSVFFDAYIGVGGSRSFNNYSSYHFTEYMGFGYTGLYFNAGFRFGLHFNRR